MDNITAIATPGLSSSSATRHPSSVDQQSKDFESFFLSRMVEQMFSSVEQDESGFSGASNEEFYRGWMADAYGKLITESGGIGIAAQVKAELLKLQEIKTQGGNI